MRNDSEGRLSNRAFSWRVLRTTATFLALAALALPEQSRAQTLPNAGSELQQLQREKQKPLPAQAPPVFEAPPQLTSLGGATVTVGTFHFAGNKRLTDQQLTRVVKVFLNRPLDFAQLQNAAIAVAEAYRKAGWVVRAYLPQQDVTSGTVTIQVVEAAFGAAQVHGTPRRVSVSRLQRMVDAAQPPGKPMNAEALDRALLLMNDLPGVSATGRLAEGKSEGQTDLVVDEKDTSLVSGYVSADNAGERFTGSARITEEASLNSLAGIGDRADAMLLHTKGSDFESLGYSLPVGYSGWRVGLSASHLSYRIVSEEFSALDAHGSSTTADLNTSYPLIRSRLANLYVSLDLADKRFDNHSNGATTSHYAVNSASAAVYGNLFDSFAGGGENTASLTFEQGVLDLAGSPSEQDDGLTADTAGAFKKVSFVASRLQTLTPRIGLFGSLTGQTADRNLDSSEKFYLGGPTSVRAYPANEGGGTEGLLLDLEVRERLPLSFSLTQFLDWGDIRVNKDNNFNGAAQPNSEQLKGAGVSVGWVASFGLSLRATVSRRIGSNPDPTSTGTDQDGSLDLTRVWVQVTMPF